MINKGYELIKKKSNKIYDRTAQKYKISSKAVLWNNPQTQYYRFYELTKDLELNSSTTTVLDVGCGNGELYKFLNFIGFRGKYTGYDINDKLLKQAKKRFKNTEFLNVDIMSSKVNKKYDYVLMSGVLNINVGQDMKFVTSFIKSMYDLCNNAAIFNAISTNVNFKEKKIYYIDPSKILNYCIENITKRVTIEHHNIPYNYTIYLYRAEDWASVNDG